MLKSISGYQLRNLKYLVKLYANKWCVQNHQNKNSNNMYNHENMVWKNMNQIGQPTSVNSIDFNPYELM